MGMLDFVRGFIPTTTISEEATSGPLQRLTINNQIPSRPYAEPAHFGYANPGSFIKAGIYEVTGQEFIQQRPAWMWANDQIVSVPERPVDKGTFRAVVAGSASGLHYVQPDSGVYLQPNVIGSSIPVAGTAPTQGIYTGLGVNDGMYEGEC